MVCLFMFLVVSFAAHKFYILLEVQMICFSFYFGVMSVAPLSTCQANGLTPYLVLRKACPVGSVSTALQV